MGENSVVTSELNRPVIESEIETGRLRFPVSLLKRDRRLQDWFRRAEVGEFSVTIRIRRDAAEGRRLMRDAVVQKRKQTESHSYRLNLGKGALAGLAVGDRIVLRFGADGVVEVSDPLPASGGATRAAPVRGEVGGVARAGLMVALDEELLVRARAHPQVFRALGEVYEIKALRRAGPDRVPGSAKGLIWMSEDFDAPLDDEDFADGPL